MTDFMRWLYANYIKPQLDSKATTGYEECLSLMDTCLNEHLRAQYDRTVEFYAAHAFLLGLHTGTGLAQSSQNSFDSVQPSI